MPSDATFPGLIAAAVYAVWGALCVWNQFRGGLRRRLRWVHLGLGLPRWELFTGGMLPIALWYRERDASGEAGAWSRVALRTQPSIWHLVWFRSRGAAEAYMSLRRLYHSANRSPMAPDARARNEAQVHRLVAREGTPAASRQFRITAQSDADRVFYESSFASWSPR